MNFIRKLPIPVSGLILAILSLGNLLQGYPRIVCGVIGVILIFLLVLRLIFYHNLARIPQLLKVGDESQCWGYFYFC